MMRSCKMGSKTMNESLESIKWGEFKLSLFLKNYHGKRLVERDRKQGKTPLLTAGEANNGVASFIGNESMQKYKDFISIDMFGNAFYHPYKATGDDNIYFFVNEKLSFYVKLFFVSCINKQKSKFSYGKQFRQQNADSLKIILPLDSNNQPNYAFMESFMRELEKKHLEKIIAYYQNKLAESIGGGG
ncbi:type II restriction endonuclease subunit S [Helicobacter muridarum]|uniref:Type II restriction endonuclease subunit S n=1 Tax=Helicobacter muridarum TaxID=216 RepID=A0A4U8TM68_9HELI|nr:type II restriction endonuclease subunit S [Helicobacter muridarum]